MRILLCIFLLLCMQLSYAEDTDNDESNTKEQAQESISPTTGNFALPASQELGPLVSVGQTIVDKGNFQIFVAPYRYHGHNTDTQVLYPYMLYGLTNSFSVMVSAPIATHLEYNDATSSGIQDSFLQLEYAFYQKDTSRFSDQATILTQFYVPTGDANKNPTTGYGSPSYLVGSTFSRMYVDWYFYASNSVFLTTASDNTKFGNQFSYNAGLGRNIATIDKRWLFAWLLEVDGDYQQKDQIAGFTNPDSGGNTIYLTPSLWISSQKLIAQFGIGFPVVQNLNGIQNKNNYMLIGNFGWKFH